MNNESDNCGTFTSRKVLQEISPNQNIFVNNDSVLEKKQTPPETDTTATDFYSLENTPLVTLTSQQYVRRRSQFRICSTEEDNVTDLSSLSDSPVSSIQDKPIAPGMDHLIKLFKRFGVNSPSNKGQKLESDQSKASAEESESPNVSVSVFYDAAETEKNESHISTIESVSINENKFRDSLECLGVSNLENINVSPIKKQEQTEHHTYPNESTFPTDETLLQQSTLPSFDELCRNVIGESSRIQHSHDENYITSSTFGIENDSIDVLNKAGILTVNSVVQNDTGIYMNTTKDLEQTTTNMSSNIKPSHSNISLDSLNVNASETTSADEQQFSLKDLPVLEIDEDLDEFMRAEKELDDIETDSIENLAVVNDSIIEKRSIFDELDSQDIEDFLRNEQECLEAENTELEIGTYHNQYNKTEMDIYKMVTDNFQTRDNRSVITENRLDNQEIVNKNVFAEIDLNQRSSLVENMKIAPIETIESVQDETKTILNTNLQEIQTQSQIKDIRVSEIVLPVETVVEISNNDSPTSLPQASEVQILSNTDKSIVETSDTYNESVISDRFSGNLSFLHSSFKDLKLTNNSNFDSNEEFVNELFSSDFIATKNNQFKLENTVKTQQNEYKESIVDTSQSLVKEPIAGVSNDFIDTIQHEEQGTVKNVTSDDVRTDLITSNTFNKSDNIVEVVLEEVKDKITENSKDTLLNDDLKIISNENLSSNFVTVIQENNSYENVQKIEHEEQKTDKVTTDLIPSNIASNILDISPDGSIHKSPEKATNNLKNTVLSGDLKIVSNKQASTNLAAVIEADNSHEDVQIVEQKTVEKITSDEVRTDLIPTNTFNSSNNILDVVSEEIVKTITDFKDDLKIVSNDVSSNLTTVTQGDDSHENVRKIEQTEFVKSSEDITVVEDGNKSSKNTILDTIQKESQIQNVELLKTIEDAINKDINQKESQIPEVNVEVLEDLPKVVTNENSKELLKPIEDQINKEIESQLNETLIAENKIEILDETPKVIETEDIHLASINQETHNIENSVAKNNEILDVTPKEITISDLEIAALNTLDSIELLVSQRMNDILLKKASNEETEATNKLNVTVTFDSNVSIEEVETIDSNTSMETALPVFDMGQNEEILKVTMNSALDQNISLAETSAVCTNENTELFEAKKFDPDITITPDSNVSFVSDMSLNPIKEIPRNNVDITSDLNNTITLDSDISFDNVVKEIITTVIENEHSVDGQVIEQDRQNNFDTTEILKTHEKIEENVTDASKNAVIHEKLTSDTDSVEDKKNETLETPEEVASISNNTVEKDIFTVTKIDDIKNEHLPEKRISFVENIENITKIQHQETGKDTDVQNKTILDITKEVSTVSDSREVADISNDTILNSSNSSENICEKPIEPVILSSNSSAGNSTEKNHSAKVEAKSSNVTDIIEYKEVPNDILNSILNALENVKSDIPKIHEQEIHEEVETAVLNSTIILSPTNVKSEIQKIQEQAIQKEIETDVLNSTITLSPTNVESEIKKEIEADVLNSTITLSPTNAKSEIQKIQEQEIHKEVETDVLNSTITLSPTNIRNEIQKIQEQEIHKEIETDVLNSTITVSPTNVKTEIQKIQEQEIHKEVEAEVLNNTITLSPTNVKTEIQIIQEQEIHKEIEADVLNSSITLSPTNIRIDSPKIQEQEIHKEIETDVLNSTITLSPTNVKNEIQKIQEQEIHEEFETRVLNSTIILSPTNVKSEIQKIQEQAIQKEIETDVLNSTITLSPTNVKNAIPKMQEPEIHKEVEAEVLNNTITGSPTNVKSEIQKIQEQEIHEEVETGVLNSTITLSPTNLPKMQEPEIHKEVEAVVLNNTIILSPTNIKNEIPKMPEQEIHKEIETDVLNSSITLSPTNIRIDSPKIQEQEIHKEIEADVLNSTITLSPTNVKNEIPKIQEPEIRKEVEAVVLNNTIILSPTNIKNEIPKMSEQEIHKEIETDVLNSTINLSSINTTSETIDVAKIEEDLIDGTKSVTSTPTEKSIEIQKLDTQKELVTNILNNTIILSSIDISNENILEVTKTSTVADTEKVKTEVPDNLDGPNALQMQQTIENTLNNTIIVANFNDTCNDEHNFEELKKESLTVKHTDKINILQNTTLSSNDSNDLSKMQREETVEDVLNSTINVNSTDISSNKKTLEETVRKQMHELDLAGPILSSNDLLNKSKSDIEVENVLKSILREIPNEKPLHESTPQDTLIKEQTIFIANQLETNSAENVELEKKPGDIFVSEIISKATQQTSETNEIASTSEIASNVESTSEPCTKPIENQIPCDASKVTTNLETQSNVDEFEENFVSGEKFSWGWGFFGSQSKSSDKSVEKGPRPSVLNLFDPLLSKKTDSPKPKEKSLSELCKLNQENNEQTDFKKPLKPKEKEKEKVQSTKPKTNTQNIQPIVDVVQSPRQVSSNDRQHDLLVDVSSHNKSSPTSVKIIKPVRGHDVIEQIKKAPLKDDKLHLIKQLDDIVYATCTRCFGKESVEKIFDERYDAKKEKMIQMEEKFENLLEEKNELLNEKIIVQKHLEKCWDALEDVKVKYDSRKEIILHYQDRETQLLNTIEEQFTESSMLDKKYETVKAQTSQQLEKLNDEHNQIKHKCDSEILALSTQVRRLQLQNESLEQDIKQKSDERAQLNEMCDRLLMKKK